MKNFYNVFFFIPLFLRLKLSIKLTFTDVFDKPNSQLINCLPQCCDKKIKQKLVRPWSFFIKTARYDYILQSRLQYSFFRRKDRTQSCLFRETHENNENCKVGGRRGRTTIKGHCEEGSLGERIGDKKRTRVNCWNN